MSVSSFIRLDASDNVITATRNLEAGERAETATTQQIIPRNHKLASHPVAKGEAIRKYAQIIG